MPVEKHTPKHQDDGASSQFELKQRRHDVMKGQAAGDDDNDEQPHWKTPPPLNHQKLEQEGVEEYKEDDDAVLEEDSDSYDTEDPSEFAYVDLQAIRKEVQCPICLGIIKKTRTVMECLHRFCRECIDKSMRMGNNECPACRTHCASRRSLRDDPRYDELINSLYPDIKKYEEEELAFHEEDETRNKQIQESMAQVLIKQSEALGKKRSANKDTSGPSLARSQQNYRSSYSRRRRRRNCSTEYQDSDDNNDANDNDKHFFPDGHREIKLRKGKSRASVGSSHSPSATNLSGESFENNLEQSKEERGFSPGLACSTDRLAWGRGGVRSNSRHGNVNGGMSGNARHIRLAKLVDFLHNLEENDDEYAALQTPLKSEGVPNGSCEHQPTLHPSPCSNNKPSQVMKPLQHGLHILNREETIQGAVAGCILMRNN